MAAHAWLRLQFLIASERNSRKKKYSRRSSRGSEQWWQLRGNLRSSVTITSLFAERGSPVDISGFTIDDIKEREADHWARKSRVNCIMRGWKLGPNRVGTAMADDADLEEIAIVAAASRRHWRCHLPVARSFTGWWMSTRACCETNRISGSKEWQSFAVGRHCPLGNFVYSLSLPSINNSKRNSRRSREKSNDE